MLKAEYEYEDEDESKIPSYFCSGTKLGEFQPDAAGEIRILISGNYSCLPESLREVNKPFQPKKAKTMKTAQNMAAWFAAMAGAALCAAQ